MRITGLQLQLSIELWLGSRAPVNVGLCLRVTYLSGIHKFVFITFLLLPFFFFLYFYFGDHISAGTGFSVSFLCECSLYLALVNVL